MTKERFKLIAAVYLVLRRGDEVLLLKRANTGYQDGKYGLVSGHLEGDELATTGMVREAKEEAGIIVDPTKLKFVHLDHKLKRGEPGLERLEMFFELWEWEGEIQNLEPEKCSELAWYPIDHPPAETIPMVANVLKAIGNQVYYSEYITEPV